MVPCAVYALVLASACAPRASTGDAGPSPELDAFVPADAPIEELRMLAPHSGSFVTTRRPMLRWTLPAGVTGAHVEICREQGCADPIAFDALGDRAMPPVDLEPGAVFWHACALGTPPTECPPWIWTFTVPRRSAPHDTSWGTRPDIDRDGDSDLLVGMPGMPRTRGLLVGFAGGPEGPVLLGYNSQPSGVPIEWNYGRSVAVGGDFLGSGGISTFVGSSGKAYLTLGFDNVPDFDDFGNGDDAFAFAVAGAGDVDGDGYADLLVGTANDSVSGTIALLSYGGGYVASSGYAVPSGDPAERFSRSLSGAGDLDGDQLADVIIGAPGANRAYVYLGQRTRPIDRAPIVLEGPAGSRFGTSVACAGDVNGDGLADVIVGAPLADRAFVYLGDVTTGLLVGSPIALAVDGVVAGDLGISVGGAGDVDGDGFGDVIVGAPAAELGFGRVYVFAGGEAGLATTPSAILAGTDGSGSDFGRAIAGLGDLDGDGFDDVAVGIPGAAPENRGAVDVFRGAMGGIVTTRAWRLDGRDGGYQGLGASIARAL